MSANGTLPVTRLHGEVLISTLQYLSFNSVFNLSEIVWLNENYMTRIKGSRFMNSTYFQCYVEALSCEDLKHLLRNNVVLHICGFVKY